MAKKPPMPCGPRFCPVPMRLLWPIKAMKTREIGALYGVTMPEVERRAEELGIYGERPHRRRMAYSKSEFLRLWMDPMLSLEQIGAAIGMLPRVVTKHGRKLGLPERKCGSKPRFTFDDEFDAMWLAQVPREQMARHYGGCSRSLIGIEAKRRKLPPRPRTLTARTEIEDFKAAKLAQAMRRDAEIASLTHMLRARDQDKPLPAYLVKRATELLKNRIAA